MKCISSGTDDDCAVYIDDSNIFIEGQKYYAIHLNLRVSRDPRFRIDLGKLVEIAVGGRSLCFVKLYGSEPPALDTVWKQMRQKGLEVELYKKNSKGKEKEIDTTMTADALEYVFKSRSLEKTVIIISGDRDYWTLVNKILNTKPEWKVELLAFKNSISRKLRDIKNVNFKVIEFETLLQERTDNGCFIEARWRTELYRLPKNSTIILHFKTPLISQKEADDEKIEVNLLLKQYAEEITKITGVPCWYHLCNWEANAGRWVYIIAYTRVKAEPDDSGIDFFRICRENAYQLNNKCSEICHLYKTYETIMESVDASNELPLQNRFLELKVDDEEEEAEYTDNSPYAWHIYDDHDTPMPAKRSKSKDQENADSDGANSGAEAATKGMDQENTASGGEDLVEESFTEVKSSSKVRKHRAKYSTFCTYEFSCDKGLRCDYKHTPEQHEFFKATGGTGRKGYKSKPCTHFKNGNCMHGQKPTNPKCAYYHSIEEARCYVCKNNNPKEYVGHASHDDEKCPFMKIH